MWQRGSAQVLLIVVAAVLGLGLAASAYLNYYQYQQAGQSKQLLQGQITDLRYQLNQSAAAASTPIPSPSANPSAAPTPTPAVLGSQSVSFTELGTSVTPSAPVADLTYSYQKIGVLAVANLTGKSLMAKYPTCRPGALGMLVRRPLNSKPSTSASQLVKSLGGFNYYYVPPTSNCGSTTASRTEIKNDISAVQNVIMPTLASIN